MHNKNKTAKITNSFIITVAMNNENCNFIGHVGFMTAS